MRIDIDFIKDILNVFLKANTAHITLNQLIEAGFLKINKQEKVDEKFIFHYQLLIENKLIGKHSLQYADLNDMGFTKSHGGEWIVFTSVAIRLTQYGHDFAQSLANKEVYSKLKSEFKELPFDVIFKTGRQLIEHVAKKKLDKILEN